MRKKIILSLISSLMCIVLLFLTCFIFENTSRKNYAQKCMDNIFEFAEENKDTIFSVDKITYFSNCNGTADINPNSSFTVSNLYQYTDIAIFINNNSDGNYNSKNTLKKVCLSNINFELPPSIGKPSLYYKDINKFATNEYDENNIINTSLDFSVTSEDEIDYSSPTLYNNCANPITLCYVNSDLKPNYTLPAGTTTIPNNGKLLKHCNVTLNSIACKISFLITIVNNLDETYTCPMILNMPLSTEKSTIYDGNLILEDNVNYKFIKKNNSGHYDN